MPTRGEALAHLNQEDQVEFFLQTTLVPGPSKKERSFAAYIEPILSQMGFEICYDEAHHSFGGDCGNLIAYWPGTNPEIEPLLFSAHMDTVLDSSACCPVIRDGIIYADGRSILGSDDRSAISGYIEAIRAIQASHMPCGPIELLLTVNEQNGLCGAQGVDIGKVRSRSGYVFDHPGDVGQVICRSPYRAAVNICFQMKGGSAGGHIAEQADRSNAFTMGMEAYQKMSLGYLDDRETVALIGIMRGGELSSIVPGELFMRGEIRSYRREYLDQRLQEMRSVCESAATAHDGAVQFEIEGCYDGYDIPDSNAVYRCFCQASEGIDLHWYKDAVLGGADTNFLRAHGINCLTLGNGYRNAHTYQEYISIDNLENIARLTVSLIDQWYQQHVG